MRPILLKGHERAITFVKYNADGDLLFSCSKDTTPCLWRADTGERIGTYRGHTGTVWSLDVTHDSTFLLTASADAKVKLWRVQTGEELFSWNHRAPVRAVAFAYGDKRFLTVTDPFSKLPPSIAIFKFDSEHPSNQPSPTPVREIVAKTTAKFTSALWGPLNRYIIATSEDCSVYIFDPETEELIHQITDHTGPVNSVSFSKDEIFFITASDDRTAKLYDSKTFKLLKTYETGKPVNAASISPIMDHILLGGGQKAHGVTTSHVQSGQFEARIFHTIFEEELGSIKGHFGPINTISYSPDGRSYTSGSEDGYLRIHHLDASYFKLTGLDELEANLDKLDMDDF
jgi:translation initiation factor 3 subunit I